MKLKPALLKQGQAMWERKSYEGKLEYSGNVCTIDSFKK